MSPARNLHVEGVPADGVEPVAVAVRAGVAVLVVAVRGLVVRLVVELAVRCGEPPARDVWIEAVVVVGEHAANPAEVAAVFSVSGEEHRHVRDVDVRAALSKATGCTGYLRGFVGGQRTSAIFLLGDATITFGRAPRSPPTRPAGGAFTDFCCQPTTRTALAPARSIPTAHSWHLASRTDASTCFSRRPWNRSSPRWPPTMPCVRSRSRQTDRR
jgi:hypothetical protein